MDTATVYADMRYSLASAVRSHGVKCGDSAAVHAQRLGQSFDDWPGVEYAEHVATRAVWEHCGLRFETLPTDARAELVIAAMDGFRSGYSDAWVWPDDV